MEISYFRRPGHLYAAYRICVIHSINFSGKCFLLQKNALTAVFSLAPLGAQGLEEVCLSLEHQNPSKTSEKMGYFDRVTVSLHIL